MLRQPAHHNEDPDGFMVVLEEEATDNFSWQQWSGASLKQPSSADAISNAGFHQ